MNLVVAALLGLASLMAAAGQLFLKAGADGAKSLADFVNPSVIAGLCLYAGGTILWVYGLSRAPLIAVYSFAALTFVFVYAGSIVFLGERISAGAAAGCGLILVGLIVLFRFTATAP